VAQLSLVININIATRLGTGAVSWISYADRLMEFPTALLGAALATILTPSLSDARARGDDRSYGELLDWGMRLAFLLALPCALALWLIATPLTATLFQRGLFTANDVFKTQQAVSAYGVGLLGLILVKILAPGYYAQQDIRTPVKIGIGVLVATQMMNVVFVPFLQHAGLALSTSVGACANALMLYVGLKRRGAIRLQPGWMVFFAQLGAGLLVLAGVLYLANHEFDWMALAARPWRRTGVLALVVGLGALAYLGTLVATGLRLSQFMRKI
jgi:putative peptidoglycan lipid II flippase